MAKGDFEDIISTFVAINAVSMTLLTIALGKFLHKMRITQNISNNPTVASRLVTGILTTNIMIVLLGIYSITRLLCDTKYKDTLKIKGILPAEQAKGPILLILSVGSVAALSFAMYAFKHPQEQLISPNGMLGLLVAATFVPLVFLVLHEAISRYVGYCNILDYDARNYNLPRGDIRRAEWERQTCSHTRNFSF